MVTREYSDAAVTFPGKDPRETFQFYFRQHWIRLLKSFLTLLLQTVFLGTLGYVTFFTLSTGNSTAGHLTLLLLLGGFLLSQAIFLCHFYRYFLYVIIVTDRKVHRIKKTLLTVDDHESIDLAMLQDISKHQRGIVQNMMGFGTLVLEGQESVLRIHFTPRIGRKYEEFMKLRQGAMSAV